MTKAPGNRSEHSEEVLADAGRRLRDDGRCCLTHPSRTGTLFPFEQSATLSAQDGPSVGCMRCALSVQLHDVSSVADGISTGSSQIAVGNQDPSGRTEQTASSLSTTPSPSSTG